MIYLDYCASAPLLPQVREQMLDLTALPLGNPGALHQSGAQSRRILQESRRTLAQLLHVQDREFFFTSGGTESNNWALKCGCAGSAGRHLIVSASEHKSVLLCAESLKRQGYRMTVIAPDAKGVIRPDALEAAICPDTALISVQAANNETGVLQDIHAIAQIAHRRRILFHCDAVQCFGHSALPLEEADLISLSAHKLGGPVGVGGLVIRYPAHLTPLLDGGGQELGLRSGTENVIGAAGFALAAKLAMDHLPEESQRQEALKRRLWEGIRQIAPQAVWNGKGTPCLPGVLNIRFPGISAEEMVMRLDLKGICVSPGAACAARNSDPSHVLLSMGLTPQEASESFRISLGYGTTEQEIDETIDALRSIVAAKAGSHPASSGIYR